MSAEASRSESNTKELQSAIVQNTLLEISSRPADLQQDTSADDCCVICLERISEACEAHPCQHHNFDYLCLITWLDQQIACPLCKTEIKEVRYGFSDDKKQWKTYEAPKRPSQKSPAPTSSTFYTHEALARRRSIYRHQLYSLHVGSNRISRYRDLTPQMFASDTELVSRARMFLRRELRVFEFLFTGSSEARTQEPDPAWRRRTNNSEFLLEYIIAILKTVDMQGSTGQAESLIQEFLGREDTRLLLHELRAWLRSPYTSLENWDRAVQYPDVLECILQGGEGMLGRDIIRGRLSTIAARGIMID
ncbi:putative RING finger protein [Colletotrichum orbiculare MAFF 240422]|uniref:RING-type E3 ubiquitin transferase n=1 Tax=Colletotrichum orbiculare (strain 104-T / ATCC 96160 / CBS 514.97 / LARS 414 / MAFF 240422) TaxID=1213857 RepID=N4V628_COLOR|nr:putative RING finger protein [Colletotrichum orbiculare MAFF 240422]